MLYGLIFPIILISLQLALFENFTTNHYTNNFWTNSFYWSQDTAAAVTENEKDSKEPMLGKFLTKLMERYSPSRVSYKLLLLVF